MVMLRLSYGLDITKSAVLVYLHLAAIKSWRELKMFCQMIYAAAPRDAMGSRYVFAIQTPREVFFWPKACPAVMEETPSMVFGAAAGLMSTSW